MKFEARTLNVTRIISGNGLVCTKFFHNNESIRHLYNFCMINLRNQVFVKHKLGFSSLLEGTSFISPPVKSTREQCGRAAAARGGKLLKSSFPHTSKSTFIPIVKD